jgi:hypothetical protein
MATHAMSTRVRPVSGVNFQPKRQRKATRKALVAARGWAPNVMADWKIRSRERAEFYRNLRQIKMARRHIAAQMAVLAVLVTGLRREVGRVGDREPRDVAALLDVGLIEDACKLAKSADASVQATAEEFRAFSRRKVYYVQELAA